MLRRHDPNQRALWGALFSVFVVQTGFGAILPLLPEFVHQRGFPIADMGLMAAAYAAVSFLAQAGLGSLTDRFGRKRAIVLGSGIEALGTAGFLWHGSVLWYIACRVLQGLGSGVIVPAANALVADVVAENRRGQAYGLMSAAGSAGFAVGPMVGGLAGAAFGLTAPFVIGAVLNVVALLGAWWTLPEKPVQMAVTASHRGVWRVVTEMWPYFWVMFAWVGMNGLYDTSWSLYMRWLGATPWVIGLSFTLFSLPLLLFNLAGGRLADRVSRRTVIIILGTGLQTFTVALYIVVRIPLLAIAISVAEAAAMSLTGPALSSSVMEHTPNALRGAVQGAFQASGTLGATLMALASGPLLAIRPNHPFYLGASMLLVTTVGVAVVWTIKRQW